MKRVGDLGVFGALDAPPFEEATDTLNVMTSTGRADHLVACFADYIELDYVDHLPHRMKSAATMSLHGTI